MLGRWRLATRSLRVGISRRNGRARNYAGKELTLESNQPEPVASGFRIAFSPAEAFAIAFPLASALRFRKLVIRDRRCHAFCFARVDHGCALPENCTLRAATSKKSDRSTSGLPEVAFIIGPRTTR